MHHPQPLDANLRDEALEVHHQVETREMNGIPDERHGEEEVGLLQMMGLLEQQHHLDLRLLQQGRMDQANGTIGTGHEVEHQGRQHAMGGRIGIGETNPVEMAATAVVVSRNGREAVVEWRMKERRVKIRDRDEMMARGPKSCRKLEESPKRSCT